MAFNTVRDVWSNLRQIANNDIWRMADAGVPTNGTTGAGFVGLGSKYVNTLTGVHYINTGTKASPVWSVVGMGSFAPASAIVASGTTTSGATTQTSITVSGALTTDTVQMTWRVAPQTLAHITATISVAGTIAVGFGATVGTAGTLQYAVIRAL